MSAFKQAAIAPQKVKTTNGAVAFDHTGNANVDFFGAAGAARTATPDRIIRLFAAAWAEDKTMALVNAFYLRDVRGGAGERAAFIAIIRHLERTESLEFMADVIEQMAEYGRWSDMLQLQTPAVRALVWERFRVGLFVEQDGLCAKWAPRRGKNRDELRDFLGLKNSTYRKVLSTLSDTVEQLMCAEQWDQIDYSKVPSVAIRRYQKAFERHDPVRWNAFALAAERGEVKINAGAIMPHQILNGEGTTGARIAQWNALPNFVPEDSKVLPMIDVSASMTWFNVDNQCDGRDVAIALGMYVAEKNTGDFANLALTFSTSPEFVDITKLGGDVIARNSRLRNISVSGSTNIIAAFDLILSRATKHKVPAKDMPTTLLIFSDMQFNSCSRFDQSSFKVMKERYKQAGYECPNIVFWNLDGRHEQTPVKADASGAALVSGYSAALCKSVLSSNLETFTPRHIMMEALSSERYNPIIAIAQKHFQ